MVKLPREKAKYYWDIVDVPYQMGAHKHRLFVLDLLKKLKVETILDVGCGTGPIYDLIVKNKYGFGYKGVDYSPNFIGWAREEFGDMFEIQDARKLKEKDESYDCVLLLHSLDHVKQWQEVLAEATRTSKKYVCLVLWRMFRLDGEVQINDRNTMSKEEGEEPWEDTYLLQFAPEPLEAEFKKLGLRIEKFADVDDLYSDQSKVNIMYLLRKEGT